MTIGGFYRLWLLFSLKTGNTICMFIDNGFFIKGEWVDAISRIQLKFLVVESN